jgi:hypothetical protein
MLTARGAVEALGVPVGSVNFPVTVKAPAFVYTQVPLAPEKCWGTEVPQSVTMSVTTG